MMNTAKLFTPILEGGIQNPNFFNGRLLFFPERGMTGAVAPFPRKMVRGFSLFSAHPFALQEPGNRNACPCQGPSRADSTRK